MRPLVAIELHDVAPPTWPQCETLLDMLSRTGVRNLTLLVVPYYHRTTRIGDAPAFVDAISQRIAQGDEATLHGFVHRDEAPPPRSLRGIVERRLLTRSEGEFAAIGYDDARERLRRALDLWNVAGWPLSGFVPPAWLLAATARPAIAERAFRYVALRGGIVALPDWRITATDVMWYSPTSAPRRWMSRRMLDVARATTSARRLLRIALHPQDALEPSVVDHWRRIVERTLADRDPVTLAGALDAWLAPTVPPSRRRGERSLRESKITAARRGSRSRRSGFR